MRPAVFLDRDGTLIDLVDYLTDPDELRLIAGAPEALRSLRAAGYACVVVTNQSAVGRGWLTLKGLDAIHDRLHQQLAAAGAALDGVYVCPEKPTQSDPRIIEHPDRKPGPGMLRRAAAELELCVPDSWMVGDSLSDLLAGRNAGCRGSILVRTGNGAGVERENHGADFVADDVLAAARRILELSLEGSGA